MKETVKQLYDLGKAVQIESQHKKSALNELIIEQMDEEQIWQQMEINVSMSMRGFFEIKT